MDISYEVTMQQFRVIKTHIHAIEKQNPNDAVKGHLDALNQAVNEIKKYLEENKGILTQQPLPISKSGLK